MKTATITWCTRYNGVYLTFNFDDVTSEMESVADEVSDTFPSLTYEMVDKFDDTLTQTQQQELIDKANGMLEVAGIDVTVTKFEYDHYSS